MKISIILSSECEER